MRNVLILLAFTALTACSSDPKDQSRLSPEVISGSQGTPRIQFEKTHHNFGNIQEGEVVEYNFKFTNVGDGDLLISEATATCGCTVPQVPKYPIAPGKSDVIQVRFDSGGKKGQVTKTVTVRANTTPSETKITIGAFVISKDES